MAKNGYSIEFEELKQLTKQLEKLAGLDGVDRAVENSLEATGEYVTTEIKKAMDSSRFNFNRTGKTKKSLLENTKVEWDGTKAQINTGFKLRGADGVNLTSVYLMYGTPRIRPDTNLKNAAKGEGIHRANINNIQQEEFNKVIKEVMGND